MGISNAQLSVAESVVLNGKDGQVDVYKVIAPATEEEFRLHNPEWSDHVFDGLLFERYYLLEWQEIKQSDIECKSDARHP